MPSDFCRSPRSSTSTRATRSPSRRCRTWAAFLLLILAYFWGLFRRDGKPWSWRSPLYVVGMLLLVVGFGMHLYGFVLRWIASGRAPLSNGHESLLWVALAVALAGLVFEPPAAPRPPGRWARCWRRWCWV